MKRGKQKRLSRNVTYSVAAIVLIVVVGLSITGRGVFDNFASWWGGEENQEQVLVAEEGSGGSLDSGGEPSPGQLAECGDWDKKCEPDGESVCNPTREGLGPTPLPARMEAEYLCNNELKKCGPGDAAYGKKKEKCDEDIWEYPVRNMHEVTIYDCVVKERSTNTELCDTEWCEVVRQHEVCQYPSDCVNNSGTIKSDCTGTCRPRMGNDSAVGTWKCSAKGHLDVGFTCDGGAEKGERFCVHGLTG